MQHSSAPNHLSLLHVQQHLPLVPQVFQPVVITQIRREKVYHDRTIINHQPTVSRTTLQTTFVVMCLPDFLQNGVGQGIQHTVAGGGADDEIICKRSDFLDV